MGGHSRTPFLYKLFQDRTWEDTFWEQPKVGKKITVSYGDKSFLNNPVFPAELYEYRRG